MLYVVCCMPHVVRCLLHAACCTLSVVCCMPHAVRCLLSVACRMLYVVCFGVRDTQLMFHVAAAVCCGEWSVRLVCYGGLRRRTFALLCPRADTSTVYECCYKCISSDKYALAPVVSDTVAAFRSDCPFASVAVRERCCRVCIGRFRDRSGVSQRCSCHGAVNWFCSLAQLQLLHVPTRQLTMLPEEKF